MAKKTIYYSDLQNDDFAKVALEPRPLPDGFPYVITNPFWRAAEFFAYRLIATPIVWLIGKIGFGLRIKNRKAVRKLKKTGYYLYGNHTQNMMDAYTPTLITFPKHAHIVVSPQTVSSTALRIPVQLLGGIPTPGNVKGLRGFTKALSLRINQNRAVTVYPEAHIWPWFTGIRPFSDASFTFPVKDGVPAVAFVTTFRKRKLFTKFPPCLTVTVSEPFYPDASLSNSEAKQQLRNKVYDFMCKEASRPDNYAYYDYVCRSAENKTE